MAKRDVERARGLVGCKFRPQGRDPASGLDCIGLVVAAFGIPLELVPRDYRLRGRELNRMESETSRFFRRVAAAKSAAGDVLLFSPASDQLHLGIWTGEGFIHADARLRRVVETPGIPPWPVLSVFRRLRRERRG